MNTRTLSLKLLGSVMAIAALSTLSGCVVETRRPTRAVYVETVRTPPRTVYVRGY